MASWLRVRLKSFEEQRDEGDLHHSKGCLQFTFAVFPKPAALFKPRDAPLDHPAFRNDGELV
jgi:hypothetical protein